MAEAPGSRELRLVSHLQGPCGRGILASDLMIIRGTVADDPAFLFGV